MGGIRNRFQEGKAPERFPVLGCEVNEEEGGVNSDVRFGGGGFHENRFPWVRVDND